jgi:Na+-translocating ferredoxin:NAD+ oxidoreductase RNF subunit RnfB
MGDLRCGKCGVTGDHDHFAVVVSENDQELGRLAPDGTTTTERIKAAVFSQSNAEKTAAAINDSQSLSAKVVPF